MTSSALSQAPMSASGASTSTGLHQIPAGSSHNHGASTDASLCEYCQAIPFREGDYSPVGESYRVQERHGEMRLFSQEGIDVTDKEVVLRRQFDIGYKRVDVMPGLPSITATAEAGCAFCKLLLTSDLMTDRIKEFEKLHKESEFSLTLKHGLRRQGFCLEGLNLDLSFGWNNEISRWYQWRANFCSTMAEDDNPCAKLLGITARPNVTWDERFATMRQWIAEREKGCHPEPVSGNNPTRLIDVSVLGQIHLVECKNKAGLSGWRYAAFSHCWGPPTRPPPLTTTAESLDKRLRNITYESLPRNYQDAVTVTRALGLRYIWIDSLCIIQDSIADWEHESSRMHEVYQGAYVTLIAANVSSCHDGFLDHLKPPEAQVRLTYEPSTGTGSRGVYFLRTAHEPSEEIKLSQWNTRGWTFQEQKSSRRRLYFTAYNFSYSCSEWLTSMPYGSDYYPVGSSNHFDEVAQSEHHPPEEDRMALVAWCRYIEAYSNRVFTNPRDRLPALSAIATSFSNTEELECGYFAGLWDMPLQVGLLWHCKPASQARTLADRLQHVSGPEFVAPSWSWASQPHPVSYSREAEFIYSHLCRPIDKVNVIIDGTDPFGRVKSGSLHITGLLKRMPNLSLEEGKRWEVKEPDYLTCKTDEGLDAEMYLDWNVPELNVIDYGQRISCDAVTSLWILPLADEDGYFDYCLLLRSTGERDGTYHRVGTFRLRRIMGKSFFDDCESRAVEII